MKIIRRRKDVSPLLFLLYFFNVMAAISHPVFPQKQVGTLAWLLVFALCALVGLLLYFFLAVPENYGFSAAGSGSIPFGRIWTKPAKKCPGFALGQFNLSSQGREGCRDLMLPTAGSGGVYTQETVPGCWWTQRKKVRESLFPGTSRKRWRPSMCWVFYLQNPG